MRLPSGSYWLEHLQLAVLLNQSNAYTLACNQAG